MSLPVYLSEEALQEEAESYLFYESKSNGLGERFLTEVEKALQRIAEYPTYYAFADDTKTIRNLLIDVFPFIIIYEIKTHRIEVYHIHHTKKDLP